VAGRAVDIADAFRIGKYNANQLRPRPVIVKVRSIWDRRLVLSSARKLAEKVDSVGFAPDEPAEIRRQKTMKRLLHKATKDGKQALIADNGLYIDGNLFFTMRDGFVRNNVTAENSNNNING
jgi:hypothetical protein